VPKATKRERQRQNKEARRAAMQEAEKRHKRNRTIRNLVLLLIPLAIIFVILQLTNSDDSDTSNTKSASNVACGAKAPTSKPTTTTLAAAPAMTIDPAKQYTAVMSTSCGDVTIALDAAAAPQTVNSFVTLAKSGFYDNTQFHRIVPDFVDQGGDPTGSGNGGPGYELPDEPPADGYQAGSVAMANAGSGTTGSQFFLVVSDSGAQQLGTTAPYKYSALGTMDAAGLKVAKKINSFGGADEKPTKRVYVLGVDISESDSSTTTTAAP
jgi:cyclophilin family peptidyl-prolyl cis-trans isomerase